MKKVALLLLFIFSNILNGQDKLITLSGIEYLGKYVGQTNDKIEFIQAGKTNSAFVPKLSVQAIILENGDKVDIQLVQDSNENQIVKDEQDSNKSQISEKIVRFKWLCTKTVLWNLLWDNNLMQNEEIFMIFVASH